MMSFAYKNVSVQLLNLKILKMISLMTLENKEDNFILDVSTILIYPPFFFFSYFWIIIVSSTGSPQCFGVLSYHYHFSDNNLASGNLQDVHSKCSFCGLLK